MSAGNQAFGHREIMDVKAAANYLGVSRSHLSHILAGKVPNARARHWVALDVYTKSSIADRAAAAKQLEDSEHLFGSKLWPLR